MSVPTLTQFNPRAIPSQFEALKEVRKRDYDKHGPIELMLSGSVGSAKTLLMAHIAVTHCLMNKKAELLVGRKAMPQLRDTILKMITDHIGSDFPYDPNATRGTITFPNGSKILPISWADGNYEKVRSYNASAAIIEEGTENEKMEYYKEIKMRIGRAAGIKEKFIILATNPDAPSHPLYEYFIGENNDPLNRKVVYSKTEDNPFLDPHYVRSIRATLTEREARRMLYGEWIDIRTDCIYYAFDESIHVVDHIDIASVPIIVSFDFNIGLGKPFSVILEQYYDKTMHSIDEIVINSVNTDQVMDELLSREYIRRHKIIIRGDAAGNARSTKSYKTDYDIIKERLIREGINFEIDVPNFNPPVRERHIKVNGMLKNSLGEVRTKISRKCKTLIKGLRLARLRENGSYVENDDDPWQHITTSHGYSVCRELQKETMKDSFGRGKM